MHPGVLLTDVLYEQLTAWVERHYREELRPDDLADPALHHEGRAAIEALNALLRMP